MIAGKNSPDFYLLHVSHLHFTGKFLSGMASLRAGDPSQHFFTLAATLLFSDLNVALKVDGNFPLSIFITLSFPQGWRQIYFLWICMALKIAQMACKFLFGRSIFPMGIFAPGA
ncbi:hypothetical protein [Microbulbifer mangrovi]|uniref:hypothetical protein n=1 Tax=Microbulbifer mangrovi TaxID=927787 RepID=UPI00117D8EF0|nr:hypothetical protein [Microbulbifer mangrovi]